MTDVAIGPIRAQATDISVFKQSQAVSQKIYSDYYRHSNKLLIYAKKSANVINALN